MASRAFDDLEDGELSRGRDLIRDVAASSLCLAGALGDFGDLTIVLSSPIGIEFRPCAW